tara:strand:+ start:13 stop:345 length:333 start_codon:yes stop_codon:yes gene_type:complete
MNTVQNILIKEYSKLEEMIRRAIINCEKNLIILDREYISSRRPINVANKSACAILFGNCSANINSPIKIAIPPDEGILLSCRPLSLGIENDIGFLINTNVTIMVPKNETK